MSKIKKLKEKFERTMLIASEKSGIDTTDLTRDDYIRITVDCGVEERLNKEELNDIGGFAEVKAKLFPPKAPTLPKVLFLDIETSPMVVETWGLFNQNIGLGQVLEHTTILSYAAKFLGEDTIYYQDTFYNKNKRDDKKLVKSLKELLERSDFVIAHNGIKFDLPKIRYRVIDNGLKPFSEVQEIDTLRIAKKYLGFDSNKLEHLTHKLCKKFKKKKDRKFQGHALWREFLSGNEEARSEMEEYNKLDILSLEELYVDHLAAYDKLVPNFSAVGDSKLFRCNCGSDAFQPAGFHVTKKSRFEKVKCTKCGKTHRSSINLISKEQRSNLLV